MPPSTYVLVHGSHTSAAAWGAVTRELTLRGHRATAVDLPGHGLDARPPVGLDGPSDMAGRTTADEIAVVVDAVRRAHRHGPVAVVAHSRGGLAVTGAVNAVPELIDHVVYVAAWCCVTTTPAEYGGAPENGESLLGPVAAAILTTDPVALGAIRLNWRSGQDEALDAMQRALLADGTRAELLAYLDLQDLDESLAIDDDLVRIDPARWGRVPHTYVRVTEDRALPVALQDRFVAEADAATPQNRFRVASLAASHLAVQTRPGPLADVLEAVSRSAAR